MDSHRDVDACLSTRNGHLYIEQCDTVDIVNQFGSPLFIVSEAQLRSNIRRFQNAFAKGWPEGPVKIMPAAKASWNQAIQRIVASEGCGCDIYSPGELWVALQSGFDPQYISVNGVPKDEDHIKHAIEKGARITIDSVEEVDVVERWANQLDKEARVRLRLKPALSGFTKYSDFSAGGLISTDIAAMVYKGGLPLENVIAIGRRIQQMPNVTLVGFHEHHGRHDRSVTYWEEQMKAFARDVGIVCRALGGYVPAELDIGGGFACPRDPFNAETQYSEPFELLALHGLSKGLALIGEQIRYKLLNWIIDKGILYTPNQKMAPTIEAYAAACTRTLRAELPKHGVPTKGVMLQAEPGRSLHGDTAIHLTTVKNIKRMTAPLTWNHIIIDSTEFWFTGGRYEHHLHDYIFANKTDAPREAKADIVGRSCYGDRLIPTVRVPADVVPGDLIAMLDVGAYQEVSMSNFNAMPRPATLLVSGDRIAVIRRAETLGDVFRRDVIPEYL
jgi:diaminopimelate decarboxylase